MERVQSHPRAKYSEPGAIADVGWARTPTGWVPIPSKDVKERIEDQMIPELGWAIRNNLMPTIGQGNPPPFKPKRGYFWKFHRLKQEWQQLKQYPSKRRTPPMNSPFMVD